MTHLSTKLMRMPVRYTLKKMSFVPGTHEAYRFLMSAHPNGFEISYLADDRSTADGPVEPSRKINFKPLPNEKASIPPHYENFELMNEVDAKKLALKSELDQLYEELKTSPQSLIVQFGSQPSDSSSAGGNGMRKTATSSTAVVRKKTDEMTKANEKDCTMLFCNPS